MTTTACKKQKSKDYHIACQNCGTKNRALHIIPLRNEVNVVGMLFSCDKCDEKLMGQKFDREIKFRQL